MTKLKIKKGDNNVRKTSNRREKENTDIFQ
jgi:hypothetical protein